MKRVLISAIAVIVVLAAVGVGISQFGAPSAEAAQGRPDDPGPPAPEQLKLELLIELSQGELFPRVGFVVTNLNLPPEGDPLPTGGAAEQWIKEVNTP